MENGKWKWKMENRNGNRMENEDGNQLKAKSARNWAITHKCTLTWKLMAHLCTVTLRRVLYHKYEMLFCKY